LRRDNGGNFTMILCFYRSKSRSLQNPKKTGFPGFLFSATRNPGFKILPRIGNTSFKKATTPQYNEQNKNTKSHSKRKSN